MRKSNRKMVPLLVCLLVFSFIFVTPSSYSVLAAPLGINDVEQNIGIVLQVGERGYLLSAYVLSESVKNEYNEYRSTLDSNDAAIKLVLNGKSVALRDYVLRKSPGQSLTDFLEDGTKSKYLISKENYENIVVRTRTGYVLLNGTEVDGWDKKPSEPTATVIITPHSLLNEGFKLANVKVNVSGIEGAAKYSITYSVYDNDNNEKTVTTKLANVGQVNEDLIQFIDAEISKIIVNLYDTNNNQINTEFETTIK